jgi:hypothetical protein
VAVAVLVAGFRAFSFLNRSAEELEPEAMKGQEEGSWLLTPISCVLGLATPGRRSR